MALLGQSLRRGRMVLAPSWCVLRAISTTGRNRWSYPHPPFTTTTTTTHSQLLSPPTTTTTPSLLLTRSYAKGKDKKGKGKQARASVTEEEMEEVINVEQMRNQFVQTLDNLKQEYVRNLSIRSNAGSIESLPVQLEGDEFPLNEVAQVSRKSPQVVIINAAAFPQALPGILQALKDSGMNINPQQEGTTIIIPIPKVTREHRENLAKGAKMMYNRCKDQLRDVQNHYIRKAKNKEGKFSEDLLFNVQLRIRELAEEHTSEAEKIMQTKQKELLQTS